MMTNGQKEAFYNAFIIAEKEFNAEMSKIKSDGDIIGAYARYTGRLEGIIDGIIIVEKMR